MTAGKPRLAGKRKWIRQISTQTRVRFSASQVLTKKSTIAYGNNVMLSWFVWNLVALLLLALAFFISYSVMKRLNANSMRVALVTFGGLPLFAWVLGTVGWILDNELAVARTAFVYAVVLLPPSLFFLFIATRRESLFNNYATNLDRLGLLSKRQLRVANAGKTHYPMEDDLRLSRWVKRYLDRFGAAYGALPEE